MFVLTMGYLMTSRIVTISGVAVACRVLVEAAEGRRGSKRVGMSGYG